MKKVLCLLVLLGFLSGGAALRAVGMMTASMEHDEDYYSVEGEEEMEEHEEGFEEE